MRATTWWVAVVMCMSAAQAVAEPGGQKALAATPAARTEGMRVRPFGLVTLGTQWYEFVSNGAGTMASGCSSCFVGANSTYADAPPWTFTSPVSVTFTITDAFFSGDSFTVFDGGVPVGSSPAVAVGAGCGPDPDTCLANAAISHAIFHLPPGVHSITIRTDNATSDAEAAYFRVQYESGIPAVGWWGLALLALLVLGTGALVLVRFI